MEQEPTSRAILSTVPMKWCPKCKETLPAEKFRPSGHTKDGLTAYCRPHMSETAKASRQRRRREFLEWMGGKCVECGYDKDWRALNVDHVNGGGNKNRMKTPNVLYRYVREHRDEFQLLCANCNLIKRYENDEWRNQWGSGL